MASLKNRLLHLGQIPEGFEVPEGLEPVALFTDFSSAGEAGLVILAMGKAYWTLAHESRFILCVAQVDAAVVMAELRAVAELESKPRRLGFTRYHEFSFGYRSFLIYGLILIGCFIWQGVAPVTEAGRCDSLAMVDSGQWARAITGMTLHGDVIHLASNLVAGLGFAYCVARFFGAPAAWLLILLSGFLGNVLTAWVYYPEAHYSIGASTAVFGALGLLTGVGFWVALTERQQSWSMPRWLIPILAGLTLLGLVGIGDGSLHGLVDVAAHISGFFCGLIIGVIGAIFQNTFVSLQAKRQWLGAFCLAVIAGAWVLRLQG
ncbi:MAG: rhomboid family intramembrane serine protease [Puniceicoccaceae bacterium]|nr:MAG: rhomboid family intramembrane serine protease [Puniceicoccaceae bacterium]